MTGVASWIRELDLGSSRPGTSPVSEFPALNFIGPGQDEHPPAAANIS